MKLLLDLQACQSESKFRGIGRYSFSLAMQLLSLAYSRGHSVQVLLNSNFNEHLANIESLLTKSFPLVEIITFKIPTSSAAGDPQNQWRLRASELLREHLITAIAPDFLHVSTLMIV